MKLVITRNRRYRADGSDALADTSNCSIMGEKVEVEFVVSFIESNSEFVSHHCPNVDVEHLEKKYAYENGFDIEYWKTSKFKEVYKKAKVSYKNDAGASFDPFPM